MKPLFLNICLNYKKNLYPTWFRWNFVCSLCDCIKESIYIPHGSDETPVNAPGHPEALTFISHMVQMKLVGLPVFLPKPQNLYPTWFRWNLMSLKCLIYEMLIYIPHGSDETRVATVSGQNYLQFISHMVQMKPNTLIKWVCELNLFISHMVQMKHICLDIFLTMLKDIYIPHGSDETLVF